MTKKIFLLTTMTLVWALAAMTAKAAIIFQDDDFGTIDSDSIIIDADGDAPGDIAIQFGGLIGETIKWSVGNSRFELSDDLDLGNNQLSTFRFENVSSLPGGAGGLGSGGAGRTVQLTATDTVAPGCTVAPNCIPNTYTWDGTAWKTLGSSVNTQYAQTVTVAESGADFTSIKSAVDSITDASAIKPYLVQVYPGTYTEAPITLPDFVSVAGVGDFSNTIVTASSATGTLFEMGLTSTLRYMTLQGASGSGGKCIRAAKASGAINIRLANCETGILVTGATTTFQAVTIVVNSGTFTDIIKVEAGAQVGLSTFTVAAATAENGIIATGTNTGLTLANTAIRSALVTNGIYLNDNAKATIGNVTVQLAQNGLRIGPTGTSTVNGSGGVITNNSVYNIFAETASAKIYYSGLVANKNKFNIPIGATRVITFNDDTAGDEALNILGELNVGIPEHPTESLFGEGDSYTSGMLVYTFNGTTYTDVTAAAQDSTGTTFTFPGTGVNNAIYVSSDRKDALGNFVKFGGFRQLTAGTAASGGSIVHEYWNGSAWTEFNSMCFHATMLYRYDASCFQRASSDEYDIFNDRIKDDWALNDPPTTGTNRYWIRLRIATALTTAPVFEQFKINPNSAQVNKDGTFTFLGDARHRRTFITGPEMVFYGQGSNSPANAAFTIGSGATSWTLERLRSAFNGTGGSIEEVSGSIALPHGIDTSNGLKARIYWKKSNNNAGNVEWKLDYLVSGPQNVPATDGSNIPTAPRAASEDIDGVASTTIQTTAAGPSTSDQVILSDFTTDINISGHYEGDVLFLRLYRDPTDANDTYASDAVLVGFEVSGVFWTLGEKL